ncbi:MAG: transcription termination/antitermination protein NusG [Pseudothermotoga sp.]|nr:MAG: Transcription termination/antitermination protein nusG [Pseudothermotoga lettingae]MDI3494256.1 transcription termination/antitermination protein NusG [Pseudothermotoga sp.]MDK2884045.1 transcription termination/antitermination protein NusG [Pseudothermotoga sp.]HBJ80640.1 transcription termination/antitermination factor NusG [Pseudothermotoga sp.]HBT26964.1 transcription termination/antitermination factor NusG [Pseudothermotoga sp.]
MIFVKKKWFILRTMAGFEQTAKENLEAKIRSTGFERYFGRILVPEETILDATSKSIKRFAVSLNAKLVVKSGADVERGDLLAEEPPIHARHSGVVVNVKNYRKVTVETIDRKYSKTYFLPEGSKLETGIKIGARIKQGMPLTKDFEHICELDGKIVENERVKRVEIQREDGEIDIYHIPLDVYDSQKVFKGKQAKNGELLADGRKIYATSGGRVEIVDLGTRKEIRIAKTHKRRLFPGYVFVEMMMNDETWQFARNVPSIIDFVSSGGQPLEMKPREARVILRLAGLETYEEKMKPIKVELDFHIGDVVKITSGPFEDFAGVVKEIDAEKQELRVAVTIFGRETPVTVKISEVERIQ